MNCPKSVKSLIDSLATLPGIGEKTAERLAFAMVDFDKDDLAKFASAIVDIKDKIRKCDICNNISEDDKCEICKDKNRDIGVLCIVEDAKKVMLFEKHKIFNGKYHILEGLISPINGIGPEDLNIKTLLDRIKKEKIEELIIAVRPSLEGEATALYLRKMFEKEKIKITRIAQGIPIGTDMEYLDPLTLETALFERKEVS